MGLRTLIGGALALTLLSTSAFADGRGWNLGLPGVFGGNRTETAQPVAPQPAPVQMAQAGDPRITEMQEQLRRMSGTLEEMNFQILQMQEQIRKQQEDNEFRFQEIEGGGGGGGAKAKPAKKSEAAPLGSDAVASAAAPSTGGLAAGGMAGGALPPPSGGAGMAQPGVAGAPDGGDRAPAGAAPSFGTITFDASGNVTGGSVGDQSVISPGIEQPADAQGPQDNTQVAALPRSDNPEEVYQNAYQFVLSGDYKTAEAGFRDHIERFPTDARNADAEYWLGESLLAQSKYSDAAKTFLNAGKEHPKSKKAPEMLLKLGVSLAGLNQRDVACATYSEVTKRYPNISAPLKQRLVQEKSRSSC
ncbi:MAG: tol-pal system protein YbgF [Methylobacterium mesophilicum]|nr:tol-pal system protein YbgF [Methylobacterium mesophilicum]